MAESERPKEAWGSRIGVILAVTGSAVGLGNFLRFPGLAAKYEGGAFMVPYFIALLFLGLPMAWAEWALGRYGGRHGFNSSPGIFRAVWKSKAAPYFGVLAMIVPVVIYMYYVLIESWCLAYAWFTASGQLSLGQGDSRPYQDFFASFTGQPDNGYLMTHSSAAALVCLGLCVAANFILIYRGLSKGIEKFCLWAMPALIVCALVVLARVLTLPNINEGLGFMWNVRLEHKTFLQSLADSQMWLDASGQIFFTLSVGFGVIINYASYVKKDNDISLAALTSCAGNEFCEVALGGMITIPAAFIFLGLAGTQGGTFSLGFKTLPMVFAAMPLGRFIGTLFFILLFLAAITSSLSMLQPAIALLEEGLGLGRKASVAMLGFITLIGTAYVVYFSKGLTALDSFDFWAGTFAMCLLALFQAVLFGWIMGLDKGMAEINRGAELPIPRWVGWIMKYISPVYLLAVLGTFLVQNTGSYARDLMHDPVRAVSLGFIILVGIFFTLIVAAAVRRWRKIEAAAQEVSV